MLIRRNPTPEGVELLPGIPQFPPYSRTDEYYMAIDTVWGVDVDYTLTYTVTVDELGTRRESSRLVNSQELPNEKFRG